jgi:hypothetical protein
VCVCVCVCGEGGKSRWGDRPGVCAVQDGHEREESRARQCQLLREVYLPQLCFHLYRVYFDTKQFAKVCGRGSRRGGGVEAAKGASSMAPIGGVFPLQCFEIANLIAIDANGLCRIFQGQPVKKRERQAAGFPCS